MRRGLLKKIQRRFKLGTKITILIVFCCWLVLVGFVEIFSSKTDDVRSLRLKLLKEEGERFGQENILENHEKFNEVMDKVNLGNVDLNFPDDGNSEQIKDVQEPPVVGAFQEINHEERKAKILEKISMLNDNKKKEDVKIETIENNDDKNNEIDSDKALKEPEEVKPIDENKNEPSNLVKASITSELQSENSPDTLKILKALSITEIQSSIKTEPAASVTAKMELPAIIESTVAKIVTLKTIEKRRNETVVESNVILPPDDDKKVPGDMGKNFFVN